MYVHQSGPDDGAVDRIRSGPDDHRCNRPDAKGFEVISTSLITAPIESSALSRRSCCRAVIRLRRHDVAAATLLAAGVSELAEVNTNGASCQPLRKM
jgi:hypothetical protein